MVRCPKDTTQLKHTSKAYLFVEQSKCQKSAPLEEGSHVKKTMPMVSIDSLHQVALSLLPRFPLHIELPLPLVT